MSQENVEIVRAGFEALNRGDIDGMLSHLTEDHEWRPPSYAIDGVIFLGHEGYVAWFEGVRDRWRSARFTPAAFSDAGDRHVIAEVRAEVIARASGTPVDQVFWTVHSMDDGKVTRTEAFASEAEALEAAGLRE